MQKIQFEDYPGTTTPVSANNLNQVQTNVEDAINEVSSQVPEVVNEESSSQTKCYSSNYTNNNFELKGNILWTNPNPTSSISQQNITVNSDGYDILECFYFANTDNATRIKSAKTIVGNQLFLEYTDTGTVNLINDTRAIFYVSSTEYQIRSGYKREATNAIIDDTVCVPLYIIGYKTGLFSSNV